MNLTFTKIRRIQRHTIWLLLAMLGVFGVYSGNAQTIVTIGTGTSITSTTTVSPVNPYWRSRHIQILYPASAMLAGFGVTGAGFIDSLAWDVVGAPAYALPGYKIKMKNTSATTAATYDGTGLTTVKDYGAASYAPVASSFTSFISFPATPFFWDGVSNILIDVCWDQTLPSYSASGTVKYTSVTNSINHVYQDGSPQCGVATLYASVEKPNIKLSWRAAAACINPPTAGLVAGVDSTCPSKPFTLSAVGASSGATGLAYQWQSSSTATGPWTNIAGAITPSYTSTGITVPTFYRMQTTCSGGTPVSTPAKGLTINSFVSCYCIPTYTYSCDYGYDIAGFETTGAVTNITNLATGCPTGSNGYSNYTSMMATAYIGVPFNIHIATGSYMGYKAWIDYNHNGVFEATEVIYSGPYTTSPSDIVQSVSIPLTALTGITRMRIGGVYFDTPLDACTGGFYGETEDYLINIQPQPNCNTATFPATAVAISNPAAICVSGDITLNLSTAMPPASGITYQWQQSNTATGTFTNIGLEQSTIPKSLTGVSVNRYYRVLIKCNGTTVLTSANVYVEAVTPVAPVLTSGQSCGPGPVTLTGTVGAGSIFWYASATGGSPLGTGTTFVTPPITSTTTFYAKGGASPPADVQIGTATTSTESYGESPFNTGWRQRTMQLMYKASQLTAAGASAGNITKMALNMLQAPGYDMPGYTVSIKAVPSSMTTLAWQTTGMTTVFGGPTTTFSASTPTGWVDFPFSSGFLWDGSSNIVIQLCWSQVSPSYLYAGAVEYTSTSGQMLHYYTDGPGSACGVTGSYSSNLLPNMKFNFAGCTSLAVPVQAFVRDTPFVSIPLADGPYCAKKNQTLELPTTPAQPAINTFLWNNGSTDSFTTISTSGLYKVTVTNQYGCTSKDSVNITLLPSPIVDLGPDTLVCEGSTVSLDAGTTGTIYFWNTGESSNTITVDDGGQYRVLVTNGDGCVAGDTINVAVSGFSPIMEGIDVASIGIRTFKFTPFNPTYVVGYEWDFGDGSPLSTDFNPTHTYDSAGTFIVTCKVASTCGKAVYRTSANIYTDIKGVTNADKNLRLYPNPAANKLTFETLGGIKMLSYTITNVIGQVVKTGKLDGTTKNSIDIRGLADGVYNMSIDTKDGVMIRKFQVIK